MAKIGCREGVLKYVRSDIRDLAGLKCFVQATFDIIMENAAIDGKPLFVTPKGDVITQLTFADPDKLAAWGITTQSRRICERDYTGPWMLTFATMIVIDSKYVSDLGPDDTLHVGALGAATAVYIRSDVAVSISDIVADVVVIDAPMVYINILQCRHLVVRACDCHIKDGDVEIKTLSNYTKEYPMDNNTNLPTIPRPSV